MSGKEIMNSIIGIATLVLTVIILIWGENIYQQINGHSIFQKSTLYSTNIPTIVSTLPADTFTSIPSTPAPFATTIAITSTAMPSVKSNPTTISSAKDGMVMVYVPAGSFQMGDGAFSDSQPIHEVYLDTFWIDQTDITNAMYAKCVQDGKCVQPSNTDHYNNPNYADHPVVYVSWYDAKAYCSWAGRQLPTEAQWEKAARGTDGRIYPWGNNVAGCALANYYGKGNGSGSDFCIGDTSEVDAHQDGASFYGAYDMAGNVWQWVQGWYNPGYYGTLINDAVDPQGPLSGTERVLRGGSWHDLEPYIRSSFRWERDPSYSDNTIGFRCAQSAP